jgi:hypothetical protein
MLPVLSVFDSLRVPVRKFDVCLAILAALAECLERLFDSGSNKPVEPLQ